MTNAEHYINGKPELYQLPDWATTGAIPDDWGFLTGGHRGKKSNFVNCPKVITAENTTGVGGTKK